MTIESGSPSKENNPTPATEKSDAESLGVDKTNHNTVELQREKDNPETIARAEEDKTKLAELRKSLEDMSRGSESGETLEDAKERILKMAQADQYMRENWQTTGYDPEVDIQNAVMLRDIIQKHGWPTISVVGEQASNDAWLITQHADHDVAFQEQCLEMMKTKEGDVDQKLIAYLEDRVLKNSGKPQKYGTQWLIEDGKLVAYPTEDMEEIDNRRAKMGLESFAEYAKRAQAEQAASSKVSTESTQDTETKVRSHLKEYLDLSESDVEKFTLLTGELLSPVFKKQYEALSDERLENIRIAIIPDEYWPKGKLGETESSAANGLITIKQSYYEEQNNPDEVAWMTHEFAHCQKYFDAGSEESYEKMMGEFAFSDIGSEHTYPNNQVEQHTFTKQFEFLRRQGKNQDQIIEMLSAYYKKDDYPFFNKLLDEVYSENPEAPS